MSRGTVGTVGETGVVLDLDGTLVDSVYQRVDSWCEALAPLGVHPPRWMVHRRVGMAAEPMVAQLIGRRVEELSAEEFGEIKRRYLAAFRARVGTVTPLPGAQRLLGALRRSRVRWAIATTTTTATARALLGPLEDSGDLVLVTGDAVAAAKPDPALIEEAARRLGVATQALWMVGDSVWDAVAARHCGASTAAVLTGGIGREELVGAGADLVYAELDHLLDDERVLPAAASLEAGADSYPGRGCS